MALKSLLPCPFCGQAPTIQPWHGGGPLKVLIACRGMHPNDVIELCEVAPMVTGETRTKAVAKWNTRVQPNFETGEVERVAAAIQASAAGRESDPEQRIWSECGEGTKDNFRRHARAALAALPPSPDAIREATHDAIFGAGFITARERMNKHYGTRQQYELYRAESFAAALGRSTDEGKERPGVFVAGGVWRDENDECWTSEVQVCGGHYVVATVHGATEAEAAARRDLILNALTLPAEEGARP